MSLIKLGEAAKILGIAPKKLTYLANIGRVKFSLTATGRRMFDSDNLTVEQKQTSETSKVKGHPLCPPGFITAKEAASIIGVSLQTLRKYVRENRVAVYSPRGSRSVYFSVEALEVTGSKKASKINQPPTVTAPNDLGNNDLFCVEATIDCIDKALKEVEYLVAEGLIGTLKLPADQIRAYVKNALMFKIQELAF